MIQPYFYSIEWKEYSSNLLTGTLEAIAEKLAPKYEGDLTVHKRLFAVGYKFQGEGTIPPQGAVTTSQSIEKKTKQSIKIWGLQTPFHQTKDISILYIGQTLSYPPPDIYIRVWLDGNIQGNELEFVQKNLSQYIQDAYIAFGLPKPSIQYLHN